MVVFYYYYCFRKLNDAAWQHDDAHHAVIVGPHTVQQTDAYEIRRSHFIKTLGKGISVTCLAKRDIDMAIVN